MKLHGAYRIMAWVLVILPEHYFTHGFWEKLAMWGAIVIAAEIRETWERKA